MTVTEQTLLDEGYAIVRQLPSGVWIGVQDMLLTTALIVGLDEIGYSHRYCYATARAAFAAFEQWEGEGDPPGAWIKHKGRGVDRLNPRLGEPDFDDGTGQ